MAWNEPGGSKDNDPWGKPKNDQSGPPDLDEVVRNLQRKLSGLFGRKGGGGGGSSGGSGGGGVSIPGGSGAWVVIGAFLIFLYGYQCFYVVAPAERAVELTFGKLSNTTTPGPHWAWVPFQSVLKDNVDEIRTAEIGYRSGGRNQQVTSTHAREALMLTRDENIVDIKFAVQYKIKDLPDFLFRVVDPEDSLRQAVESAVREVVGKSDMDFVLTEGRSDIAVRVAGLTQEILDRYQTGLLITSVNMQSAQAPEEVQGAFDDAVKAREDQQRLINEAEAYSNDILPRARGGAARLIEESNAYKNQVIAEAEGEAARFSLVLAEYQKAPEVTRKRLYMEAVEDVFRDSNKVMLDVDSGSNVMFLPLDRIVPKSGETAATAGATDGLMSDSLNVAPLVPTLDDRSRSPRRDVQRGREPR